MFYDSGIPLTIHLCAQHSESGASDVSGAMRYHNPCVFWLQCQQDGKSTAGEMWKQLNENDQTRLVLI